MPRFRFRAQAALDLRVREHDAALRELARAETEQQQARVELEAADGSCAEARRTADEAMRTASNAAEWHWYRFWIVRLDRERDERATVLEARTQAVGVARSACFLARQKRESLERFREKAQSAHLAAENAIERKLIDELATRRYAVRPVA